MKEIKEVLFLVEESEEGGYEAKALGHSIYTQAEDLESLKKAVKDVIKCHFEEEKRPQVAILHIVKDENLTL
jgi:predicted RNase H-like HicB family nuclease